MKSEKSICIYRDTCFEQLSEDTPEKSYVEKHGACLFETDNTIEICQKHKDFKEEIYIPAV